MNNLPRENIYGHTKKLRYLISHILQYADLHGGPLTLLDFGCGNGIAVSQYLIREGIRFYGVDIHDPSLEYARRHFAAEHAFFLDHIPDGVLFDIIVYADVLEHLSDPASLLTHHRSLLKQEGIIIGAIPNGLGPFELEKRLDKRLGLSSALRVAVKVKRALFGLRKGEGTPLPYNEESGHIQFFSRKSFNLMLQQTGFKLTNMHKGTFVGAPLSEFCFLRGELTAKVNSKIADYLPFWAISSWYFTARKTAE